MSIERIKSTLLAARDAVDGLMNDDLALRQIEQSSLVLVRTLENKGRIFACGNGGSMSDAMHYAEELTGRYQKNRPVE